jgi:hypothetical protein
MRLSELLRTRAGGDLPVQSSSYFSWLLIRNFKDWRLPLLAALLQKY